jgi:TDG/mug DNA glycosylase family protein
MASDDPPPETLPDLLRDGLDLVFVGINPGLYSAQRGHYFARRTNRFWPALSRSVLSEPAREGLGVAELLPEHDRQLADYGIGFTDVVKRPTRNASELAKTEFADGVPHLLAKLVAHRPRLACFQGVTGYRPFERIALGMERDAITLGLQPGSVGSTRLFLVPSPSPANAHFTLADQITWYDRLAQCLAELR